MATIGEELETVLAEYQEQAQLKPGQLFVVGCSTSEVVGEKIGTSGSFNVAAVIYDKLQQFAEKTGVHLLFQGCEHLNRAITLEREVAEKCGFEEVSVVPSHSAGGALSTHVYHQMKDPAVVEFVQADGGIDIGDTFIGMHIKHVAVPVRCSIRQIGEAHVTLVKRRPKLIGGPRAVYHT